MTQPLEDLAKAEAINRDLPVYEAFQTAQYKSRKVSSYFHAYEDLLGKYVGKPITFVDIGIQGGGSLFMWRKYFGAQARIIGIELNPAAKKFEEFGFEIFIGDQGDPDFWRVFFKEVGNVDVVLDDGGHTNRQQIVTFDACQKHINDGGTHVVEDTHTSYFRSFGNPSRHSFVSFSKRMIDSLHSRFPGVDEVAAGYGCSVSSMTVFESAIAFHIDRRKCFEPTVLENAGISEIHEDFRYQSLAKTEVPFLGRLLHTRLAGKVSRYIGIAVENQRLRRFFG